MYEYLRIFHIPLSKVPKPSYAAMAIPKYQDQLRAHFRTLDSKGESWSAQAGFTLQLLAAAQKTVQFEAELLEQKHLMNQQAEHAQAMRVPDRLVEAVYSDQFNENDSCGTGVVN